MDQHEKLRGDYMRKRAEWRDSMLAAGEVVDDESEDDADDDLSLLGFFDGLEAADPAVLAAAPAPQARGGRRGTATI